MNLRENQYKKATDVLYKLVAISYANKTYARYPCFKVEHRTAGYFHTLEDAERRINELVASGKFAVFGPCEAVRADPLSMELS